ncbi:hemolysin family protein [Cellvibrio sp. OA-2007]|uniref:hemolysin family protein n=1 Tax=Cellvibrio sp. OA-2007 TaxID=529823 RepID=UPI000785A449|nr:hemolysin family protein [Cellvibrio sp. OA-2007]
MEIFVLLGLIVLNGLFAMSEIAIVTAKKSRLMALAAKGNSSAQVALRLAEDPTQFLSTVQIGITSIGIMNGIFGESILAEPFALWLQTFGVPVHFSDNFATILVVVVVTYLSIVVGELVPKRIGQLSAERIACFVAKPMQILAIITKPFVYFLSGSTRALMRMMGFHHTQNQQVTEEDIHAILDEGSSSGILEQQEHAMVKNVLRLEARSIVSLMVPRSDVVYLDTALPLEENYQRVMKSPHSRFPVCTKQNDNLIGVINAKELLAEAIRGSTVDLESMAQPCHVVPESLTAMELLEFFRSSHSQMVFVVDEYGDLKGIVTLQDLLEALTGEFILGEGEDAFVIRRDDGSLLLDGMLPIVDLKDCLAIDDLPEEGNYQTLNGLIMLLMGRMPATGDKVVIQNWQLEIVDMDGRRIDKVLAYCIAEE